MKLLGSVLVPALWLLALTVALFVLAIEVWQGAPILGMIGPLGTWAIARRYPQTEGFAWGLLFVMMVWLIVLVVLCRLLILPMPRLELEDLMPPP